ncbi:MAG: LamG domain-containing protein [Sedimentisphaerales bacterium]
MKKTLLSVLFLCSLVQAATVDPATLEPNCLIILNMNDNDVCCVILTNGRGAVQINTTGITNPTILGYHGESSMAKIDDTHYFGYLQDSGYAHYMTSSDGLTWDVCSTTVDLGVLNDGKMMFSFLNKTEPNYYLFVRGTATGQVYDINYFCFDVTGYPAVAPRIMNNGLAVLSHGIRGADGEWDAVLANPAVAVDSSGNWHMIYDGTNYAYTPAVAWQQGYAKCHLTHNPPSTTDDITFTKGTSGKPIANADCAYLAYVPDRDALLMVGSIVDVNNSLSPALYYKTLSEDLNLPWHPGAMLYNRGGTRITADVHLMTNYSAAHPILMMWEDNNQGGMNGMYECYIDLTLTQLYDRAQYKSAILYGNSSYTSQRTVAGKIGNAINFNGTNNMARFGGSTVTNYADGNYTILDWNNTDWSISLWAKQDANTGRQDLIGNGKFSTGGATAYWTLGVGLTGYLILSNYNQQLSYPGTFRLPYTYLGNWHHYLLTYSASTCIMTVYLDGVAKGTKAFSGINIGDIKNLLSIGGEGWGYWNGDIDAVFVFNKVLTTDEIAYLYNSGDGREDLRHCIGFVDFPDFAVFAEYWLQTGTGLPSDLNGDGVVNIYDLKLFVDEWLCSCPYNWPLR